jgi:hypothetical protein
MQSSSAKHGEGLQGQVLPEFFDTIRKRAVQGNQTDFVETVKHSGRRHNSFTGYDTSQKKIKEFEDNGRLQGKKWSVR